jgi:hypothetical protein
MPVALIIVVILYLLGTLFKFTNVFYKGTFLKISLPDLKIVSQFLTLVKKLKKCYVGDSRCTAGSCYLEDCAIDYCMTANLFKCGKLLCAA